MIRQFLVQVIAKIPAQAEPVRRRPHQLPFGAEALEEHDELQFEENDGINRRTPSRSIERSHQRADKGEVERFLEMAVEMVRWDKLLQGDIDKRSECAIFATHHGTVPSLDTDQWKCLV